MDSFLALPDSLYVDIIGDWLKLGDLPNLDSSFCNFSFRFAFLELLTNPHLIVDSYGRHSVQFVNWLIIRKVKLISLSGFDFGNVDMKSYLQLDLSKLLSLSFPVEKVKESDYLNIILMINSCASLTSLEMPDVKGFGHYFISQIKPETLGQLKDLSLDYESGDVSVESIKYIQRYSERLAKVSVCLLGSMTVSNSVWLDFFANLQHLQKLTVSIEINDVFLMGIANECKSLTKFNSMKNNQYLTMSIVADFTRQASQLKKMFLEYFDFDEEEENVWCNNQSIFFRRNTDSGEMYLRLTDNYGGYLEDDFHEQIVQLLLSLDGLHSIYMTTKPFWTTSTIDAIISKHRHTLCCLDLYIHSAAVSVEFSLLVTKCLNLHTVILQGDSSAENYIECCLEPFKSNVISVVDLSVVEFDQLTNEMVFAILNANKQLQKLTVERCKMVDLSLVTEYVERNGLNTVVSAGEMFHWT